MIKRLLGTLAALLLTACSIAAQERGRVLNGYAFMPSKIVAGPFAVSYFSSSTGGGVAFDLKTPFIDLEGDTLGTLDGDVGFLSLGFEYQQRFGSWFAARIGFGGGARIGIDEQSVLAQGVTACVGSLLAGRIRYRHSLAVLRAGSLYTGWDDFAIGLETSLLMLERPAVEDDYEALLITFSLRYWP